MDFVEVAMNWREGWSSNVFGLRCVVGTMSVVAGLNYLETVMSRDGVLVYCFVSGKSRGRVSAMREVVIMNCDEALVWMLMR